jgi:hypothetical protein
VCRPGRGPCSPLAVAFSVALALALSLSRSWPRCAARSASLIRASELSPGRPFCRARSRCCCCQPGAVCHRRFSRRWPRDERRECQSSSFIWWWCCRGWRRCRYGPSHKRTRQKRAARCAGGGRPARNCAIACASWARAWPTNGQHASTRFCAQKEHRHQQQQRPLQRQLRQHLSDNDNRPAGRSHKDAAH